MKFRIFITSVHFALASLIAYGGIYLAYPDAKALLQNPDFPLGGIAMFALVVMGTIPFLLAKLAWHTSKPAKLNNTEDATNENEK